MVAALKNPEVLDPEKLKFLREKLPDFKDEKKLKLKIKRRFRDKIVLPKIDPTVKFKIDRKALPAPTIEAGEEYVAPRDEVEERLVDIWSDILGVARDAIGIDTKNINANKPRGPSHQNRPSLCWLKLTLIISKREKII